MAKHLIKYVHVEETTYHDWIEADTLSEALEKVENGEVDFENEVDGQGIEIVDIEVLEEGEE